MERLDLTKFTYEEFCKALYSCRTAAEVKSLVKQDYGIVLEKNLNREDSLRSAYEQICQQKAPAAPESAPRAPEEPEAEQGPRLPAGRYEVRIKAFHGSGRGRAGFRFAPEWSTHTLTAEQATMIAGDPVLQIKAAHVPAKE